MSSVSQSAYTTTNWGAPQGGLVARSSTEYGSRSLDATVTCKTARPNPSYPRLRCPSDIQVLRAETSSSSPDLDIFITVIWLVCFPLYLPLAVTTISFVTIDASLNYTLSPRAVSRPRRFVSVPCPPSQAQPKPPILSWCRAWLSAPACGLPECCFCLTVPITKQRALKHCKPHSAWRYSLPLFKETWGRVQGSLGRGISKIA